MKRILIIFAIMFSMTAAHAASVVCTIQTCSWQDERDMCGVNAVGQVCDIWINETTGDAYACEHLYPDVDVGCHCTSSDKVFRYDIGCVCVTGMYGPVNGACSMCPSGGFSSPGNNTSIYDCYTNENVYEASAHGTVNKLCYWSGSSYASCAITALVACDAGYYRATSSDMFCTAVGDRYYSPGGSNLNRYACPSYTNPSGGQTQGYTTGSGTGADAATDCFISPSDTWEDTTGSYIYKTCYYSY